MLTEAAGHPRVLEFTVQACSHILQSCPTEAKAILVKEKLESTLATVAELAKYLPLSELLGPPIEEEAAPDGEEEEAARARKEKRAGLMLCRQLKGVAKKAKDLREKRELHRLQRPWRAYARLLLARCASLIPPPPPEPKPETGGDEDDDDDTPPPPPPPPEGAQVLAELSRAAVLAMRADCPALLLSTCAQLRNTFDQLPAAEDTAFAYRAFQAMPRLSQADDKDPPPDITPELWKPLLRSSEALIALIAQLRDGGSIGGRDPFAVAIAAKGTPGGEGGAGGSPEVYDVQGDAMSTHVKGPRRWFETRVQIEDAVSVDFDWISAFILLALRQLQMARQWNWQQQIALTFDDLTEGHYGSRLMPFLEQAQQKIGASKWCDGEPLPQVKRRVAELARDQSACLEAIEGCRQAMHALQTRGGGLKDLLELRDTGEAAHVAAIQKTQEMWRDCATMCRARRETAMVVESLAFCGLLQLADGKVFRAAESWNGALDVIFTTQDVCKHWLPFFAPGAVPLSQKVSLFECSRALGLLGCLTRHTTPHRLERRVQLSLFASHLGSMITSLSVANPSRLIDWAGFRLTELPASMLVGEVIEDLELLDGLHAMAATLIAYEMPLRALPLLAMLKYLATDIARNAQHSVAADALTIDALTQLGQIDHAAALLTSALAAADMPLNALQLPAPAPDGEAPKPPLASPPVPPAFLVHLPPESEANAPAVRALLEAEPAAHLATLAGEPVVHLLMLARAKILLKITERVPSSAVATIAAEAAGGGVVAAPSAADPKAKGKVDPKAPPVAQTGAVSAAEMLRAVEADLDSVYAAPEGGDIAAAPAPAAAADELPPSVQASNFALRCDAALLKSVLAARRGMLSEAIAPLHEAMSGAFPNLPWSGLESDASGSVSTLLFSLQPGAVHWLRLRVALASICLQQGQLDAADNQIDTGRTETNQAHDKRMLRSLLLLHARLRVERGELPKAADEFKLWLEDAASGSEVDGLVVAVASMKYASILVSLSAGIGVAGGGPGASKIVSLLRTAEEQLRKQAESHGMLSSEKWPALSQPTPGVLPGGPTGEPSLIDVSSLHNLYLKPLPHLVEAKLRLATGLQLASAAPNTMSAAAATDAAAVLLSEAKAVAERTLHPRPSLVARVLHELGRALRVQATRSADSEWGGVGSVGAATAPPEEGAPPPAIAPALVAGASVALVSALRTLVDGEQVDPGLQTQILLELVILHGGCLVKGGDAKQLYLAAAYLHHATGASAARRAIHYELPGAPITTLDAAIPLPLPLEAAATQAATLAAGRGNTMPDSVKEGRSSRDLLWMASALLRSREMPHLDQDGYERKLLLLHGYLKSACKPFAEAIVPPPPPPGELTVAVPAGFIAIQWHEPSPMLGGVAIEPNITLVFLVSAPPPAEEGAAPPDGPFLLGKRTMPRSGILATSRLVQQQLTAELGVVLNPLADSLRAVKELLLPPGVTDPEAPPGSRPPTRDPDEDPGSTPAMRYKAVLEEVKDSSLANLATLFDPRQGAACTDEPLCAWMHMLLTMAPK